MAQVFNQSFGVNSPSEKFEFGNIIHPSPCKRKRHISEFEALPVESSFKKSRRHSSMMVENDIPDPSLSFCSKGQFEMYDKQKEMEVERLRSDFTSALAQKDRDFQQINQANSLLHQEITALKSTMEKMGNENRILKKAVNIQNNKGKELELELMNAKKFCVEREEYIKRLEQINYALKVHLGQGSMIESALNHNQPPDVC